MVSPREQAARFENVSVTLGGVQVLNNVIASIPRGGSTAIIGPNGAGKTTLILALFAHVPYEGRVHIPTLGDGRTPKIGYVPQKLVFDWGLPNREVVAEGTPEEVLTPKTLGSLFGLHMGIGRVQSVPAEKSERPDCHCEGDHHA